MVSVFKVITNAPDFSSISEEDVEESAAVGSQRNNVFDYAWVASHIVQKQISQIFEPLIEQLCKRGEYIMKRLADIGFSIVESRSSKKVGSRGSSNEEQLSAMRGYSYFQSTVRDVFFEYVDKTAQICKRKCMDELACTQLIYWETAAKDITISKRSTKESNVQVLFDATLKLFTDIKDTIVDNVVLKCHNFFVIVMQRDLSGEILRDTSSFDDKFLEEMFELTTAKERLKKDEEIEKANQLNYQEKESVLRDLGTQFSRLKLVASS